MLPSGRDGGTPRQRGSPGNSMGTGLSMACAQNHKQGTPRGEVVDRQGWTEGLGVGGWAGAGCWKALHPTLGLAGELQGGCTEGEVRHQTCILGGSLSSDLHFGRIVLAAMWSLELSGCVGGTVPSQIPFPGPVPPSPAPESWLQTPTASHFFRQLFSGPGATFPGGGGGQLALGLKGQQSTQPTC